jgi:hypothetical protein
VKPTNQAKGPRLVALVSADTLLLDNSAWARLADPGLLPERREEIAEAFVTPKIIRSRC